jgi:phosphonate transport system substrate-binding protein
VLLAAASDPEGVEAMRRFFDTTRFTPVDDALREDLSRLAPGVRRIKAELE